MVLGPLVPVVNAPVAVALLEAEVDAVPEEDAEVDAIIC